MSSPRQNYTHNHWVLKRRVSYDFCNNKVYFQKYHNFICIPVSITALQKTSTFYIRKV